MDELSGLIGVEAHAVLRAENLERARRFYAEVLGLEVSPTPDAPELRVHTGTSMICIYERPTFPASQNTVACFEVADIETTVAELRERGVTFEEYDLPELGLVTVNGIANVNGQWRAWFKDSEGNALVISQL